MTSCPRPQDLYLYLEGELGPYEAAKLEEHLEICAACRDALAERRLFHEAIVSLPPFEVPGDFAASVMEKLPEPEEVRSGWLAPLAAGAAALAVGLVGFSFLTGAGLPDILVAFNRFLGAVAATVLPVGAKVLKLAALLLDVSADAVSMLFSAGGAMLRSLGPAGVALTLGLGGAVFLLALFGARRLISQGERS
ncbi:MAG TPA: anti-sigma factor [Acidobacteriota bacterium]|nr:anti-sigma factor [Acidobacteriota bacterium]